MCFQVSVLGAMLFLLKAAIAQGTKFAATELEALALLETGEHFKLYLAGRDFVAYTDHQALLGILEGVPSSAKLLDGNTNWWTTPSLLSTSRESRIQWQMHCPSKDGYSHCSSYINTSHCRSSLSRIILLLQCLLTKHRLQRRGEVWSIHPPHTHSAGHCYNY